MVVIFLNSVLTLSWPWMKVSERRERLSVGYFVGCWVVELWGCLVVVWLEDEAGICFVFGVVVVGFDASEEV